MDDTCAVQVVIHMLDFRLEINVSRFLGTYQYRVTPSSLHFTALLAPGIRLIGSHRSFSVLLHFYCSIQTLENSLVPNVADISVDSG